MKKYIYKAVSVTWISTFIMTPAPAQETDFDCVIDPAKTIKVASPVRGILDAVLVERGDTVKKGQVIARMESSVETSTVELNRLQAEDTALVDVEVEELALKELTYNRAATLGETNAVSKQQLDELGSEFRVQKKELARSQLEHKLAELELARSEANLALRTIRSPDSGVITERNLSGGEFVHEDGHIVTLVKLHPLHVETFMPIEMFDTIKEGQIGFIEPDPPFSGRYEAKITVVDPVFDPASGTFGVRLELANKDKKLPGGLRCRVSFAEPVGEMSDQATAAAPASAE